MTEKVHTRCNGQIRYVCTSRSLIGFVEYFYRFFFFLAARAISFAKKICIYRIFIRLVNISRVRVSQHSYFISCFIRYIRVEFDAKKLLQFFSYAYSPKRRQKLIYQSRV